MREIFRGAVVAREEAGLRLAEELSDNNTAMLVPQHQHKSTRYGAFSL
jgi:hypothetical protein